MLNRNKILGSTFLIGVCSAALVAVETPSQPVTTSKDVTPAIRNKVSRHTVGYLQKENEIAEIVKNANKLFEQSEYIKARDEYIKAKKLLTALNPEYFRERIKFCDKQINLCYYEIANQALKKADQSAAVKDYDDAIKLCKDAAEYYPECKIVMEKKIARYNAIRQSVAIQKDTSADTLLPDKALEEYETSVSLRRARALVNAGLYEKAKRIYEDILVKNPYRSDVLQDLRAVATYIEKGGKRRNISSRRAAITANELEWALPIQRQLEKNIETMAKPVEKVAAEQNPLEKKLKSIFIPRIEFDRSRLREVIQRLVEMSERHDPSKNRTGVNIFLRQNLAAPAAAEGAGAADQPAAQQPAAQQPDAQQQNAENAQQGEGNAENEGEEEGGDEEDGDDESTWTELDKRTLTLPPMQNQSLEQIIRNICANAKLRYRVEKYAVVIEEENMPETDLITKIFPVDGTALSDAGDPSNSDHLKRFFSQLGVTFPEDSRIVFDDKISRIFATNTLENLDKIERICEESLSGNQPMVQIQLRIIEISQTDLNALGFNYTLTDHSSSNAAFDNFNTQNQLRGAVGEAVDGPNMTANFNMGEFSLGVDVKALNDVKSRDVLASPRVTTLPGEEVVIKLVTQTYFVEDFEEGDNDLNVSDNGDMTYTSVGAFPNFYDTPEELGITFRTTPSIDKNNSLINMKLDPEIKTLVGWTLYDETDEDGFKTTLRTPNIAKRSISTNVTVRDGETLVLGGVIEDTVAQRKDKVPLLGDIPLLGRLFQSRSRQSVKKNLLIFVTPRLVRPDGTLWKPENHESNRGIARFL